MAAAHLRFATMLSSAHLLRPLAARPCACGARSADSRASRAFASFTRLLEVASLSLCVHASSVDLCATRVRALCT
eukprot:9481494-Pyramimonas_sp.AAC.1